MSEGSATRNEHATASAVNQGEFSSHVARDNQQTTHGHKPGVVVGNEAVPESGAKTMPPGTAPASRTFQPNVNTPDVTTHTETTSASDTVIGASSGDVHTGLGHPGSGMSSNEQRHDGGKTHRGGLQGVGAMGAESDTQNSSDRKDMSVEGMGIDASQKVEGENATRRGEDRRMHDNPS